MQIVYLFRLSVFCKNALETELTLDRAHTIHNPQPTHYLYWILLKLEREKHLETELAHDRSLLSDARAQLLSMHESLATTRESLQLELVSSTDLIAQKSNAITDMHTQLEAIRKEVRVIRMMFLFVCVYVCACVCVRACVRACAMWRLVPGTKFLVCIRLMITDNTTQQPYLLRPFYPLYTLF